MEYKHDSRILAMQQVIKQLRSDNLSQGYCFMIFDNELPEEQAYYEYPDGCINIEQLDKNNFDIPRLIIKTLSKNEAAAVKQRHEVFQ